jgi:tetratricopeptide (TPR) repeat protein
MSRRDRYLPDLEFWSGGNSAIRGLHKAKALVAESKAFHEHGRFDEAIEACRRAVALCPEWGGGHNALAYALTRRGYDYVYNPALRDELRQSGAIDEAIHEWRQAISLGWSGYGIQFSIGNALNSLGNYDEAANYMRLATDLKVQEDCPQHWTTYGDSGEPQGPDFVIIGALKCGTTSLYEYMKGHPQVLPAVLKEIEYFVFPERGRAWYLSHFPRIPAADVRFVSGEATASYLTRSGCKERIFADYPKARLIALVREPVDRAISHFYHDRKAGFERRTLEEAITQELDILEALDRPWEQPTDFWKTQRGYLWTSMYAYFLEDWLTVFPKEQLLVLLSEDLYGRPAETTARVFAHLGLPDHRLAQYEVHYKGDYDKRLAPRVRERLTRFFAPHNARLEEVIGRRLPWQAPERSPARVMQEVTV